MPNTREKLIELLRKELPVCDGGMLPVTARINEHIAEMLADHLIPNGVTIQKWIPVTERLPEPFVTVLVQMPGEKPFPTVREGFISKDGIWHSALYDREADEVTHWMPMPDPPKEDS